MVSRCNKIKSHLTRMIIDFIRISTDNILISTDTTQIR